MPRTLELIVILFTAPLWIPLLALLALVVRVGIGAPVLFRQQRPGLHGRAFELIKFRTMRNAFDTHGVVLPDSERLTSLGRLMRATSLDELPELINVLRGEMSIVGPRPLLMDYLPRYSARHQARHNVRPGITGWAQINGRNALDWPQRFEMDLWYVQHRSLALDLRIIFLTMLKVLKREGVSAPGQATMHAFEGYEAIESRTVTGHPHENNAATQENLV